MTIVLLAVALLIGFEILWTRLPGLRPYRWHFRGMLVLFWAVVLLIAAGSWFNVAPALYYNGIPRFASDAATYQAQAAILADRLRAGSIDGYLAHDFFNYSRLLALLNIVFGPNAVAGGIFNAVFYMASLVAVFYIGRQLFDDRVGLLAAWLLACSPTFLLHETQTLRWAATTAGLHVAVLGTLFLTGRRWVLGFAMTVCGFAVLVSDLPYASRLYLFVLVAFMCLVVAYRPLGRQRLLVAVRVLVLALALVGWYQWAWPARAGSVSDRRAVAQHGIVHDDGMVRVSERSRLDRLIAPVLLARAGFLNQARVLRKSGVPVGTAIEGAELGDFWEFVLNVPSALRVAMIEPSISRLLSGAGTSSGLKKVAIVEMLMFYAVTALSFWGIALVSAAGPLARLRLAFIVILVAAAYVLLGSTVLNGGTLHRLRQPYAGLLYVFAATAVVGSTRSDHRTV